MNIYKAFRYAAFICLSLAIPVIANDFNDACVPLKGMLLCQQTDVCPEKYHTCNTFDTNTILQNENHFQTLEHSYYTNIGTTRNICNECNENQNSEVVTIEPIRSAITKRGCIMGNKFVPLREGLQLNDCLVCVCEETQTRCIQTCTFNTYALEASTVKTTRSNCVGLEITNPNRYRCYQRRQIKNIACCVDNACQLNHCKSCVRRGTQEICNECEEGYYFSNYAKNKCHSIEKINEICEFRYSIDLRTNTFHCLECNNGYVHDITRDEIHHDTQIQNDTQIRNGTRAQTETRPETQPEAQPETQTEIQPQPETRPPPHSRVCVCKPGYYGDTCEHNYNAKYCSNNGVYDVVNRICDCNLDFYGRHCELNLAHHCENGVYDRVQRRCVCEYGYNGRHCEHKQRCIHGRILNDVCMCNRGFSGDDCSIFFTETTVQLERKQTQLQSYFMNPCKHGIMVNNTCACENGYTRRDCGVPLCVFGNYDRRNETCMCLSGYYGDTCEFSCTERCSHNGNICGNYNHCVCNKGWFGEICDRFSLPTNDANDSNDSNDANDINDANDRINKVQVSNSLNISYTIENIPDNIKLYFELIENRVASSMPFKITIDRIHDFVNSRNASRILQSDDVQPQTTIVFNTTIGLINDIDRYYVYPNNSYTLSYNSGRNIMIRLMDTVVSYFIYIEPIRIDDITIMPFNETNSDNDNGNLNNTNSSSGNRNVNNTQSEQNSNRSIEAVNMGEITLYSILAGTLLFVSVVLLCCVKLCGVCERKQIAKDLQFIPMTGVVNSGTAVNDSTLMSANPIVFNESHINQRNPPPYTQPQPQPQTYSQAHIQGQGHIANIDMYKSSFAHIKKEFDPNQPNHSINDNDIRIDYAYPQPTKEYGKGYKYKATFSNIIRGKLTQV